jgi:hypothetical protein
MLSHRALLQLSRRKLERESSTREPRLLRLLMCASMADMICSESAVASQPTGEHEVSRKATQEEPRHDSQSRATAHQSTLRTRKSVASLQSGRIHPHPNKYPPAFSRPKASVYDLAAFRRSLEVRTQQTDGSSMEFDSSSGDSEPICNDDDDASNYSSEDDKEPQPRHDHIKHIRGARNVLAS